MSNYKKVYFRINTVTCHDPKHGVDFEDQQKFELFHTTIKNIFLNDGWEVKKRKYASDCTTVIKDKQELYLHPQEITGVVAEDNISYIENLLSNNEVFSFRKTDIYEDVFDITDEQYLIILQSKKKEIESDILEVYKTKRSNLYIISDSSLRKVIDKYRIKRLSHYVGVYSSNNIEWKFIEDIFDSLVDKQKIITAKTKNGTGYRTIKEKEKKKTA